MSAVAHRPRDRAETARARARMTAALLQRASGTHVQYCVDYESARAAPLLYRFESLLLYVQTVRQGS